MFLPMNGNPTREKIILLLKKHGPMTIEDLGHVLNITSMGIRQHLLSLERRGYIDYVTKRQGIGRPAFMYRLTEKAQKLFPLAYDEFLIEMFREIEKREGRQKIDQLFSWHKQRFLAHLKDLLPEEEDLSKRLSILATVLSEKGYLTEITDSNDHFLVKIYNCPIFRVSIEYQDVCVYDLELFRELLGTTVSRETCISIGDYACTYTIPKNGRY